MGFSSFSGIIPLFVHHLTDSALLVGLVPAIHNMGWQLPQLLMAGWLARVRRYKPLTLWMTIHERLPFLGLACVALFVPQWSKSTILILTFLMLIWQGFGAGLAANPWTSLVSKVIPQRVARHFFWHSVGGIQWIRRASPRLLAGIILDRLAGPWNFSLCFALTFVFMACSFFFLSHHAGAGIAATTGTAQQRAIGASRSVS